MLGKLDLGRDHNMNCFPDLLFYDAEQRLLINMVTSKKYFKITNCLWPA